MDARLAVALARRVDERVEVTGLCERLGISRQSFYVYERRFSAEGVTGLLPRSRAPRTHPNQTPAEVEDAIVARWQELRDRGLDHGARSIWAWMKRAGEDPPSSRTVHRVLVRRGLVAPQPQKRPRSSYRRFRAAQPNGIWQIDGMEWPLADGRMQVIVRILDDHSRKALGSVVAEEETGAAAWAALCKAIDRYGLPAMFLSDNSLAFNGSRKGREVAVERRLRELGVAVVPASARHPQTCGKCEREHQTLQKWLAAHPAAATPEELLRLVEAYDRVYNTERPHQSLHDGLQTPDEAYAATPKAGPATGPLPVQPRITQVKVSARGELPVGPIRVQVGRGWEGARLTVIRDGNSVAVFHGTQLVEARIIDPNRRYQPNGKKPLGGGRRLPRQAGSQPAPSSVASRGQGGAPAAQRGRTTLTPGSEGGPSPASRAHRRTVNDDVTHRVSEVPSHHSCPDDRVA
jgi:transposase InsO family protein